MKQKAMSALGAIKKQTGISTVNVIIALAIGGLIAGIAVKMLVPAFQKTTQNGAFEEIHLVVQSMREIKHNTGTFAPLANFAYLITNGYIDSPAYTTGVNQNVYGRTITAVRASGNSTATMTYIFADASQCLNMVDRLTQIRFLSSTSCTSATLTTTVS